MRCCAHTLSVIAAAVVCVTTLSAGTGGGSLVRTTVIGGVGVDAVTGMQILPSGDIAVCGHTTSGAVSTVPGLYKDPLGGQDAFVAVVSSDLSTLKYWTYYGGRSDDMATAMVVLPNGTIVVTGSTETSNLTMSVGAFAQLYGGEIDGFVIKLSADLDSLFFSTYIPGGKDEHPLAILSDVAGSVYICGTTNSPYGFLTNNGYDRTYNGGIDAFVLKLSPNGGSLAFSTYFGSPGDDAFRAMTLTGDGGLALTGFTKSNQYECYPVPSGWWPPKERPYDNSYNGGSTDAILTIMSQDGARLISSGYFGGGEDDYGNVIHADIRGDLFVAGSSSSPDLPTLQAAQTALRGGSDAFLATFDSKGMALLGSSFLGGGGDDAILSAVSTANNVWTLLGFTTSRDLSSLGGGSSGDVSGASDLFIVRASVSGVSYLTTFGWSGNEAGATLVQDAKGDIFLAGSTDSRTISWSGGSVQNLGPVGTAEGFISKWAFGTLDLTTPRGGERVCAGQNFGVTWSTIELGSQEEFELQITSDGTNWQSVATKVKNRSLAWKVPTTLLLGTQYLMRIQSSRGHISTASGTFSLKQPADIVTNPAPKHVCAGEDVTLIVVATGEALTYLWKRNGVLIPNASSPQLSIFDIPTSKAGTYEAVVVSPCGSIASAPALVQVDADVTIIEQPQDRVTYVGQSLTLSVGVLGLDLEYVWYHDGAIIPNANTSQLIISPVTIADSGEYRVAVVGSCGTDSSRVAVVVVSTFPVGVSEESDDIALTLVPNPAEHFTELTLSAPSAIVVTDIQGRTVLSQDVINGVYPLKIRLNLETLTPGAYIVSNWGASRILHIIR
ncbi:MAG: hypothetical protein SGJ05_06415 [bacterium]|nr:hypothetical protein [bacterium]